MLTYRHYVLAADALVRAVGVRADARPQAPLKTIEDGALDRIELFVPSLDNATGLTVVIRPFDATTADLGTGGKDGKEARQQEAKTMQSEAPRVLAERFVAALQKSGPFKAARLMKRDEPVPRTRSWSKASSSRLIPAAGSSATSGGFGAGKSSVKAPVW